jgi:hypothetical protein
MGLREIKKELQNFEKPQLIELILELYSKDKTTKDHMNFFMNPDEEALLEKFKERVGKPFGVARAYRVKVGSAKSALTEFKKYGVSSSALIRLHLHFVDLGIQYSLMGNYFRPPIYRALAAAFNSALALIDKEGLHKDFQDTVLRMVQDARRIDQDFYHALRGSYAVNFHEEPPKPK